MTETILFTVDGAVATITHNRPDKLNAANPEMAKAIIAAVTACNDSDTIRCVIVNGTGPKAYCAGSDISDIDSYETPWDFHNQFGYCNETHVQLNPTPPALTGRARRAGREN